MNKEIPYSPLSNDPDYKKLTLKVLKDKVEVVETLIFILNNDNAYKNDKKAAKDIVRLIQSVLGELAREPPTEEEKKRRKTIQLSNILTRKSSGK